MKQHIGIPNYLTTIGIMVLYGLPICGQADRNYFANQKKAFAVSSPQDCESSLKFCDEAIKVIPNHPVLNFLKARLHALLGDSHTALIYLNKAVKLGYTSNARWLKIHPMNDPAFINLRHKTEFREIIKIMKISDKSVQRCQTAFTVKDKKLGTEGLTYDPLEKLFYLGSDHCIYKVDHDGTASIFTKNAANDGLGWVNGIHADWKRRNLWACSNKGNKVEIFKYNLPTGKLIKKYSIPSNVSEHMFNDLVIHPNGDVYVTDTNGGALYKISIAADTLKLFLEDDLLSGPNGITIADNGRTIYTTTNFGICKININTRSIILLLHEADFHTYGLDGLYFKDNHFYAVQNELLPQISRFSLNSEATKLLSCEVFEKNTDDLRAPTSGVLVGDDFYFIADSQGKGSKRQGIVVMKASIKILNTPKK